MEIYVGFVRPHSGQHSLAITYLPSHTCHYRLAIYLRYLCRTNSGSHGARGAHDSDGMHSAAQVPEVIGEELPPTLLEVAPPIMSIGAIARTHLPAHAYFLDATNACQLPAGAQEISLHVVLRNLLPFWRLHALEFALYSLIPCAGGVAVAGGDVDAVARAPGVPGGRPARGPVCGRDGRLCQRGPALRQRACARLRARQDHPRRAPAQLCRARP